MVFLVPVVLIVAFYLCGMVGFALFASAVGAYWYVSVPIVVVFIAVCVAFIPPQDRDWCWILMAPLHLVFVLMPSVWAWINLVEMSLLSLPLLLGINAWNVYNICWSYYEGY